MRNLTISHFLIIGKANAGKTLFMLNFAEYMGYKNLTIKFKTSFDEKSKTNSTGYFKNTIVSSTPNTTRTLQIINVNIPVIKGKKHAEFIDTTGLSSTINFDHEIREGMVQTLQLLRDNNIILHIIDASSVSRERKIDDIDLEIYRFGKNRGNYILLANKIDLKESKEGIKIIQNSISDVKVIEISALCKTGFNEVKKYVSKLA